jgi:hypothetical protein
MTELYPEEALFAGPLPHNNGVSGYADDVRERMLRWCQEQLDRHAPSVSVYIQDA